MKNTFNFKRLNNFILRQATLYFHSLLIAFGVIFGGLLIISLLVAYFNPGDLPNLKNLYLVFFFISGAIFTSKVFDELHFPQRSYAYLTLPVSTEEKLVGSWFVSSPIFIIFYSLIVLFIFTISKLIATQDYFYTLGDLFDKTYLIVVAVFMVIQTIFFLGAVYFRKNNFLKTLFSLFLLSILIGIYSAINVYLIFEGNSIQTSNGIGFKGEFNSFLENEFGKIMSFIFWYLLGPFMVLVSYFKLKEREV